MKISVKQENKLNEYASSVMPDWLVRSSQVNQGYCLLLWYLSFEGSLLYTKMG